MNGKQGALGICIVAISLVSLVVSSCGPGQLLGPTLTPTMTPTPTPLPMPSVLEIGAGQIESISFHPDGSMLAIASDDETIRLWNMSTYQEEAVLKGRDETFYQVAFAPDGRLFSLGMEKEKAPISSLHVWDVEDQSSLELSLGKEEGAVFQNSMAIHPDGQVIAIGGCSGGEEAIRYQVNGMDLRITCDPNKIYFIDANAGGIKFSTEPDSKGILRYIVYSPDGNRLAYADSTGNFHVYDMESNNEKTIGQPANDLAYSPDGSLLAVPFDNYIFLWNVESIFSGNIDNMIKKLIFEGHTDTVTEVIFSPDGNLLVSGSKDKTIRIWDVKTGVEINQLEGHSNSITDLAFSPSGNYLASGSSDGTVRLWDVETFRSDLGHSPSPKATFTPPPPTSTATITPIPQTPTPIAPDFIDRPLLDYVTEDMVVTDYFFAEKMPSSDSTLADAPEGYLYLIVVAQFFNDFLDIQVAPEQAKLISEDGSHLAPVSYCTGWCGNDPHWLSTSYKHDERVYFIYQVERYDKQRYTRFQYADKNPVELVTGLRELRFRSSAVAGPFRGSLQEIDKSVGQAPANVKMLDFIAEAYFENYGDADLTSYNYGIIFRASPNGAQYSIVVTSDRRWLLLYRPSASGPAQTIAKGSIKVGWRVAGTEGNRLRLEVSGASGVLKVNDFLVAELDLSKLMTPGDIYLGAFFLDEYYKHIGSLKFEDFIVYEKN